MASRREMLIEILDYCGFNFLELEQQDANFSLKKLAFAFLTVCVLVPNFPEKLHIARTIRC